MNIFSFNDYRELIRETMLARKAEKNGHFTFSAMAEDMRVRHTYLSTVLAGNGHLSSDQAFIAAKFLKLTEYECEFLMLLHEYCRSTFPLRRKVLKEKLEELRKSNLQTDAHLPSKPLVIEDSNSLYEFYSDINALFVHMFLTIAKYRKSPDLIGQCLRIDAKVLETAIQRCIRAGIVERAGTSLRILKDDIHLPVNSPLLPAYRVAMRLKALELLQSCPPGDNQYSLSVLFSGPRDSYGTLRAKFLEFLKWAQQTTQADEAQEVFQMNFDLLKWT